MFWHGLDLPALYFIIYDAIHTLVSPLTNFIFSQVLLSVNKTQMDQIISALDTTQLDVLMKYIYRGFERPSEGSSAILLLWHEKVYNVGGVGCIVRVLTDRKRV